MPLEKILLCAILGLSLLGGCSESELPEESDLLRHLVAMNGDGEPLDPHRGLEPFASDEAFDRYLDGIVAGLRQGDCGGSEPVKVLLYFHGALNTKTGALKNVRTRDENGRTRYQKVCDQGYYPIFVNWDASILFAYWDHLWNVRQGRKSDWWGPLSSPFYLLGDALNAVQRIPLTWLFQSSNRTVAEFPSLGTFKRIARERHRHAYDRMTHGAEGRFRISRFDPTEGPQPSWWRTPWRFTMGVIKAPFQLTLSPVVGAAGTPAWTNYLRRTTAAIHRPDQFRHRPPLELESTGFETTLRRWLAGLEGEQRDDWSTAPPSGALAMLMGRLMDERHNLSFTVIGHSTGAILVNRLIESFPDFHYQNIVYLAAASTVDDFRATVLPYLERSDLPLMDRSPAERRPELRPRFYNVTLDTTAEAREELAIVPNGSLLEWLDVYFTRPPSDTARVIGKWENLMAALPIIPLEVRDRVYLTKLPYGNEDYPQRHGDVDEDFGKYAFWSENSWKGLPESGANSSPRADTWRQRLLDTVVNTGIPLLLALLCAVVAGRWAVRQKRPYKRWLLLGFFFNALALLYLLGSHVRARIALGLEGFARVVRGSQGIQHPKSES